MRTRKSTCVVILVLLTMQISLVFASCSGSLLNPVRPVEGAEHPIASNHRVLIDLAVDPATTAAQPTTLFTTWDLSHLYAQTWSKDAQLLYLNSVDVTDPEKTPGQDGRRRIWQAAFTSPDLNRQLFIQIADGEIVQASEDAAHDPGLTVITEKPQIDSPTALEQVISAIPDFGFSVGRGKGYHFILAIGLDGETPILIVVGSSKSDDGKQVATSVDVDPTTGEIIGKHILPQ